MSNARTQLMALITMIASFVASGVLAVQLTSIAGREKLVYTTRAEDAGSLQVSAGIAMGAFRGIFVNWLWIRANDLKEAGKFHEANDLSNAITTLQPRFPRVWVFHAWNMAYNISVSTQTPSERWEWVNAGIRLLRDRGIPANPNDMLLHKELGWIFAHKIGGYTDDANVYYKLRLATEWQTVLGAPPVRERKDGVGNYAAEKHAAWLRAIADAPDAIDQAIAAEPSISALRDKLFAIAPSMQAEGMGMKLLRQYEVYRTMVATARGRMLAANAEDRIKAFGEVFSDPAYAKAWPLLIAHVRKRVLIDEYHMEPERMIRYTLEYGPLDWRHPATHALYWSQKGVEAALPRWTERNKRDYDFINTDRIAAQAVQELFRSGEIYFDYFSAITGEPSTWQGVPNVRFAEAYSTIIEQLRDRSWADQATRAYSPLSAGYENFLRDLVCFFYRRGELELANNWYTRLRTWDKRNINDPYRNDMLSKPLSEFVEAELLDRYTSPYMAVQQVYGSLGGAYASGLLGDDLELFRSQFEFAKMAHRYFMQEQLRATPAGGELKRMQQMDPDFQFVAGTAFIGFLGNLSMSEAETAFLNAPDELKAYALFFADQPANLRDRFGAVLDAEAALPGGRGFDQVFIKPANYEALAADIAAKLQSRRSKALEVEQK